MTEKKLLTPLAFSPIFKEKVWGGRRLQSVLGKSIPPEVPIGESWEISGYPGAASVIENGPMAGSSLPEVFSQFPKELVGDLQCEEFPLLYKFIDAQDRLSVQVHPDNAQAQMNNWGRFGKTECWYIVDAPAGTKTIAGFKRDVTIEEIRDALSVNKLEELLNFIDIAPGDLVLIGAGTVHANLTGTLLYEVQQTSDTTLRFYDWARNDPNRALHIEESLKVVDTKYHDRHKIPPVEIEMLPEVTSRVRVATQYFTLWEFSFADSGEFVLPTVKSFRGLTVLDGNLELQCGADSVSASRGKSLLIPGAAQNARVSAEKGTRFLLSWVPDLQADIIQTLRAQGISDEQIELLGGNPSRNDLIPFLRK